MVLHLHPVAGLDTMPADTGEALLVLTERAQRAESEAASANARLVAALAELGEARKAGREFAEAALRNGEALLKAECERDALAELLRGLGERNPAEIAPPPRGEGEAV